MNCCDQPSVTGCATPSTVNAWVPAAPRLRFSTTVSTGTPSAQEMPAPRQTTESSSRNQDFQPDSVDDSPRTACPTAA